MELINLYTIKINQVQIFLMAAECESFTRAAEYLHLTQPMISKTVGALEQELGIVLFIRSHGRLQLTPAGHELYIRWQTILRDFENSLSAAHRIQEGKLKRITLGIGSLAGNGYVLSKLNEIERQYKNMDIFVEQDSMNVLIQKLAENRLDAIILSRHLQQRMEYEQFDWKIVEKTNLAIFVSVKNPLVQRKTLRFSDLRNQSFIAFSEDMDRQYISLLDALAADNGFVPRIAMFISNELSFRPNLILNKGIVLADTSTDLDGNGIRKFPLLEYGNDVILVWKKERMTGALKAFIGAW